MVFVRTKKVKGHTYYYLVEAYREDGRPKQRTLEYLGSPERILEVFQRDRERAEGTAAPPPASPMTFEEAVEYGAPAALHAVAEKLDLASAVNAVLPKRNGPDVGRVFEAMVINRCLDPVSRRKMPKWFGRTALPGLLGLPAQSITEDVLYNVMDRFDDESVLAIQERIWTRLKELGADTDRVFYDLTSTYFEGELVELSHRGYSRDHRPDRLQVNIGVTVNEQGLPITHEVFPGNRNDVKTVKKTCSVLKDRFGVDAVVVMDRGMTSKSNRKDLTDAETSYIMGVPMSAPLQSWTASRLKGGFTVVVDDERYTLQEDEYQGRRMIIVRNDDKARDDKAYRDDRLDAAEADLEKLVTKIGSRSLKTKAAVLKRARGILAKHKVKSFFALSVNERGPPRLTWKRLPAKIRWDQRRDGRFLIETNTTLSAKDVFAAYHERDVVERFFRTMKHVVDLRPVYVRKETRVKAHVFVCVTAVLLIQWLREELRLAGSDLTAVAALEDLEDVMEVAYQQGESVKRALTRRSDRQTFHLDVAGADVAD